MSTTGTPAPGLQVSHQIRSEEDPDQLGPYFNVSGTGSQHHNLALALTEADHDTAYQLFEGYLYRAKQLNNFTGFEVGMSEAISETLRKTVSEDAHTYWKVPSAFHVRRHICGTLDPTLEPPLAFSVWYGLVPGTDANRRESAQTGRWDYFVTRESGHRLSASQFSA